KLRFFQQMPRGLAILETSFEQTAVGCRPVSLRNLLLKVQTQQHQLLRPQSTNNIRSTTVHWCQLSLVAADGSVSSARQLRRVWFSLMVNLNVRQIPRSLIR